LFVKEWQAHAAVLLVTLKEFWRNCWRQLQWAVYIEWQRCNFAIPIYASYSGPRDVGQKM